MLPLASWLNSISASWSSLVLQWWQCSPCSGIKLLTCSLMFVTFDFSAVRCRLRLAGKTRTHLCCVVFPPTGNVGWISVSEDCELSSSSLLDCGTVLCKYMVSFLSILWSIGRKDVVRCLHPSNFSKWKIIVMDNWIQEMEWLLFF